MKPVDFRYRHLLSAGGMGAFSASPVGSPISLISRRSQGVFRSNQLSNINVNELGIYSYYLSTRIYIQPKLVDFLSYVMLVKNRKGTG